MSFRASVMKTSVESLRQLWPLEHHDSRHLTFEYFHLIMETL
jgi:hypothetical protein